MKIIKIQFGSPKVYTYLLDFKVKDVPKKGDILKHIAGATEKGPYFTAIKVIDVENVKVLPEIVTSVLTIYKNSTRCEMYQLKQETINKLRASPVEPKIVKPKKLRQKDIADAISGAIFSHLDKLLGGQTK